jgi:hypothetical protein
MALPAGGDEPIIGENGEEIDYASIEAVAAPDPAQAGAV